MVIDNYYDSIASGYDELHGEEQLKKLRLIKHHIYTDDSLKQFRPPYTKLLDVGCGSGIATRFFEADQRYGIDPSMQLIRIAIKNDPDGRYIVSGAENMPFLKKEFDIVISLTAIQNFTDLEKGLLKIRNCSDKFILTFLKRSEKSEQIEQSMVKMFNIIRRIEEDKDIIYFCAPKP